MNTIPRILIAASLLATLAACGNKGPLVQAPPPGAETDVDAPAAAAQDATTRDTATQEGAAPVDSTDPAASTPDPEATPQPSTAPVNDTEPEAAEPAAPSPAEDDGVP